MSDELKIEINMPEEIRLLNGRLKDEGALLKRLAVAMDRENELTVGEIQEKRLSSKGPTTLAVRTGRLRRSLRPSRALVVGGGVRSGIGSNVKYMGVHEFGIDSEVTVRPHTRKRLEKKVVFGSRRVVRVGDVNVRQYTMHMKQTARAPIRLGILDRVGHYERAFSQAMVEHYTKK